MTLHFSSSVEASAPTLSDAYHSPSHRSPAYQNNSVRSPLNGDTHRMSLETTNRSFHRRDRRTLPERLTTREVTKKISEALADVSAKEIADASGSSLRAAENAKQGINAMSLVYFFNAAQNNPELNALAMEWLGRGKINAKALRGMMMILNANGAAE